MAIRVPRPDGLPSDNAVARHSKKPYRHSHHSSAHHSHNKHSRSHHSSAHHWDQEVRNHHWHPKGSNWDKTSGMDASPERPNLNPQLALARSRFAQELEDNPQLRERIMAIAAGENPDDPRANLADFETMMNRADMMGTSLEREGRTTAHGGYYTGYDPNALNNPHMRAMIEHNLETAIAGSNVSNFATDNASGRFAARRTASGLYTPVSSYGGETFSYPSGKRARGSNRYRDWLKKVGGLDNA